MRGLLTLVICGAQLGCLDQIIMIGYLIGGPPSIEPAFDIATKNSLTDRGVVVAVVCYAPDNLLNANEEVHHELARYLTFRLNEHHIKVINPDLVRDWLDRNDDWDKPEEVGAALHATHVIYVDLHEYGLFEQGGANLYRGTAEALISVIELDENGDGESIFSRELTLKYPLSAPRPYSEVTYDTFKRQYLSRLSEEIGRLFYEYYNGDDILDAV